VSHRAENLPFSEAKRFPSSDILPVKFCCFLAVFFLGVSSSLDERSLFGVRKLLKSPIGCAVLNFTTEGGLNAEEDVGSGFGDE
jgi:hypothetical protein